MKKINKETVLAIVLVVLAIIVITISIIQKKSKKETFSDINIVLDYNSFYTVDSCIYRFITYVNSKDSKSLYSVLSEEYKQKSNLTEENVLDKFNMILENSTFISKKMYYQKNNIGIEKYYIYGVSEQNTLNEFENYEKEQVDLYFIVYLDSYNQLFSIEPYDGKIFMEGELNEK